MQLITINQQDNTPLVEQIVNEVGRLVESRLLRPGSRLPSIRQFSSDHGVSRFTTVQAYDRLVASGHLESRKGSGFYVSQRNQPDSENLPACRLEQAVDVLWLLHRALQERNYRYMPGCGVLPNEWLDPEGIRRSMRSLARADSAGLVEYGHAAGFPPLRQALQRRLAEVGIAAESGQIITTHGISHAIDLVGRYFMGHGDKVLVDDPAYFNLFGCLRPFGAHPIGVPWNDQGPDCEALERLLIEHRPKLFFTNTVLHNPTGVSISPATAHRVLQLADQYDLIIVEDDIYGDFHPGNATRLATLDQLNRVIYLNSFSKSVSASLRVGYLACHKDLAQDLIDLKLLTHLTTTELSERLLHQVLAEGHHRKHLARLHGRLDRARSVTLKQLDHNGFRLERDPGHGMFLWAELPDGVSANSAEVAQAALTQDTVFAPGNIFSPQQPGSRWMRFNAAFCQQPVIFEILNRSMEQAQRR